MNDPHNADLISFKFVVMNKNVPSSEKDKIIHAQELQFAPFSLPGFSGGTHAAFPNLDTEKAPLIALLRMDPGAELAKHYHPVARESVYVVEGEMINDGEVLKQGSFLVHGPNVIHGPHKTLTGCTLMFIQYPGVGPDDSVFI